MQARGRAVGRQLRSVEISEKKLAGTTRLELATSAVTGQRSNQLNYVPAIVLEGLAETLDFQAVRRSQWNRLFQLIRSFGVFFDVLWTPNGHQISRTKNILTDQMRMRHAFHFTLLVIKVCSFLVRPECGGHDLATSR